MPRIQHVLAVAALLSCAPSIRAQDNLGARFEGDSPAFILNHASSKKSLCPVAFGGREDKRAACVEDMKDAIEGLRARSGPQIESFYWVICKALDKGPSQLGRPLDLSTLRFDEKNRSPGSYFLVCARTGLVLDQETGKGDVNSWGMVPKTHSRSRHQRWRIERGSGEPMGPYKAGDSVTLVNVASGQALRAHDRSGKTASPVWCENAPSGNGPTHRAACFQWTLLPSLIATRYKLTLESIHCVRPSSGQDEWTAAMFRMIDVSLAAASGAGKAGSSILSAGGKLGTRRALGTLTRNGLKSGAKKARAVTRTDVLKAGFREYKKRQSGGQGASTSTADDALKLALEFADFKSKSSQKLFNAVYGESPDDLEVRINGISIWPNGGRDHRKVRSQQTPRPGTDFLFARSAGASIALIEYDSGSDDDDLGSVQWQAPKQGLQGYPERFEHVIVHHEGEGSLYELTFTVAPLVARPPTVEVIGTHRMMHGYEGHPLRVRVDGYAGGDGRLEWYWGRTPPVHLGGKTVTEALTTQIFPMRPLEPGSYRIDFTDGGHTLCQNWFEIVRPEIEASDHYEQGEPISVRWSGLLNSDSIIAIGPRNDPSLRAALQVGRVESECADGRLSYSGTFTFKPRPERIISDRYVLRLYDGADGKNVLVASKPLQLRRGTQPPMHSPIMVVSRQLLMKGYPHRQVHRRTRSNVMRTVYLGTLERGVRYEVVAFGEQPPELTLVDRAGNRTPVRHNGKNEVIAVVVPNATQPYRAEVTMKSEKERFHDWGVVVHAVPEKVVRPEPKVSAVVSDELKRILNTVKGNLTPGQKFTVHTKQRLSGNRNVYIKDLRLGHTYVAIAVGDAGSGRFEMTKLATQLARVKGRSSTTKSGATVAILEWECKWREVCSLQLIREYIRGSAMSNWELVVLEIAPPPANAKPK